MSLDLVSSIQDLFVERSWTLGLAESCTGGRVAAALVEKPGASAYFLGSVVSYSNSAKNQILGVLNSSLQAHSAVSLPVAEQMAVGAKKRFKSTWAMSTSGFAGPDFGSKESPKGTLCISVVGPGIVWKEKTTLPSGEGEEGRLRFLTSATDWSLQKLWQLVNA